MWSHQWHLRIPTIEDRAGAMLRQQRNTPWIDTCSGACAASTAAARERSTPRRVEPAPTRTGRPTPRRARPPPGCRRDSRQRGMTRTRPRWWTCPGVRPSPQCLHRRSALDAGRIARISSRRSLSTEATANSSMSRRALLAGRSDDDQEGNGERNDTPHGEEACLEENWPSAENCCEMRIRRNRRRQRLRRTELVVVHREAIHRHEDPTRASCPGLVVTGGGVPRVLAQEHSCSAA